MEILVFAIIGLFCLIFNKRFATAMMEMQKAILESPLALLYFRFPIYLAGSFFLLIGIIKFAAYWSGE